MATYFDSEVLFTNHVLYRKSLGTQTTQNNQDARVTWFTVPSGKYLRFLTIFPDSQPGFGGSENDLFKLYLVAPSAIGEAMTKGSSIPNIEYSIQLSTAANAVQPNPFSASRYVGTRVYYLCNPVYNDSVTSITYFHNNGSNQFPNNSGGYPNGYTDINSNQLFEGSTFSGGSFPYFPPGTIVQYNYPAIAGPSPENYNLHISYYLADYAGNVISPTAS